MSKLFGARPNPVVANNGQPVNPNMVPPVNQTPAAQNAQNQQTLTHQSQQTDANGLIPAGGNQAPPSPLDAHKTLWDATPINPDAPQPVKMPTPQEIMAATSKVDFKQIMKPELMAKIAKGGPEAEAALAEMLNQTSQATYGQSVIAAQGLVAKAVEQATTQFQSSMPTLLKKQTVTERLFKDNPTYNHPALSPVVTAYAAQFQEKFPKASSDDLYKMVNDALKASANALNPPVIETPPGQDNEDWSLYLGEESPFSGSRMTPMPSNSR
jgi:hypothetical protein